MAITRNRMVPIVGIAALVIVGVILAVKFRGGDGHVKADAPMTQVPGAQAKTAKGLPQARGADQDTPAETLKTVVADENQLRGQVQQVLEDNKRLQRELDKAQRTGASTSASVGTSAGSPAGAPVNGPMGAPSAVSAFTPVPGLGFVPTGSAGTRSGAGGVTDGFGAAMSRASGAVDSLASPMSASGGSRPAGRGGAASGRNAGTGGIAGNALGDAGGDDGYQTLAPMGYAAYTAAGRGGPATTTYVRTSSPGASGMAGSATTGESAAAHAAQAAQAAADARKPVPYFTIPENATLVGATSMTSLIGRVPVDGRVTDPMQFKLVVGHDNLAANGFELPDDLAGMIVSGVAIGDMALSCSEGKIQSVTFVFNDGAIRTVSHRGSVSLQNGTGGTGGSSNSANDLGYISDMHGNPCIQGKFVTNAGAFLADIIGVKTLSAAGQAYSAAQTMTSQSTVTGGTTSAVTGNISGYALGQAVAGAGDEVTKWLLAREKNSFDAVVTPSGQQLVVHIDRELDIDKDPGGRKLVHRSQETANLTGERYGLE